MEEETYLANYYSNKREHYRMNKSRKELLLGLVPLQAQSVLELGCGWGELAKVLQEEGKRVVGVDISPDAIGQAQAYLEKSFVCDIGEPWPRDLTTMRFDLVVASEVIEHLFDPDQFLEQVHQVLKDDGAFIITTPNVLFWKQRLKMLRGHFRYEERGIMDFGHIRFFTLATARDALVRNHFGIERERHFYPNLHHRGLDSWGSIAPGLLAYQMIFLCKKQ